MVGPQLSAITPAIRQALQAAANEAFSIFRLQVRPAPRIACFLHSYYAQHRCAAGPSVL